MIGVRRSSIVAALLVGSAFGAVALAWPEDLHATRTVGDQARALRLRRIDAMPEPHGPRLCSEGEVPSDRDPCTVATSRAVFGR